MGRIVDSILPRDQDNQPIQVLAPSSPTNVALAGTSTATALPAGSEIVDIGISEDAYIVFGTGSTTVSTSNGMFIPKGLITYRVPVGATHLAHIASSATGRLTIWKLV